MRRPCLIDHLNTAGQGFRHTALRVSGSSWQQNSDARFLRRMPTANRCC